MDKHMSVIPATEMLRQENDKFEASLGYTVRSCQRKKWKEGRKKEGRKEGRKRDGRQAEKEQRRI
jgi:hypothetical protein